MCDLSVAPAVLAVFLGKPLLTGRGHRADLWKENLANWDGYGQLLSSQHLHSELSLFFFFFFFCISINCFSGKCYLCVLLACRKIMLSSRGRHCAYLLTQFVWHYCLPLDAMSLWQTQVYDAQTRTLKRRNSSAFMGIKSLTAPFLLSGRTIKAICWWWGLLLKIRWRVRWMSWWVSEG